MNCKFFQIFLFSFIFSFKAFSLTPDFPVNSFPVAKSENKDVQKFIDEILELKGKTETQYRANKENKKDLFLFFSDFDGTIIKGDITEGLEPDPKNHEEGFLGLQELGIEKGYSKFYKGKKGYKRYLRKYLETARYNKLGSCFLIMFPFIEMKQKEKDNFKKMVHETFKTTLYKYIFKESNIIINTLQENNIAVHILSASPDFFVKGSIMLKEKNVFDVPESRIFGMTLEREGYTYAEGKWKEILSIKENYEKQGYRVHILGGMGNSYHTDGPFLKSIAQIGGKSLMINGGDMPEDYKTIPLQTTTFTKILNQ